VPLDRLASSNLAEAIKKGITMELDALESKLRQILHLLEQREEGLGLSTWNTALSSQLQLLVDMIAETGIKSK
jgi:hypothetical protein